MFQLLPYLKLSLGQWKTILKLLLHLNTEFTLQIYTWPFLFFFSNENLRNLHHRCLLTVNYFSVYLEIKLFFSVALGKLWFTLSVPGCLSLICFIKRSLILILVSSIVSFFTQPLVQGPCGKWLYIILKKATNVICFPKNSKNLALHLTIISKYVSNAWLKIHEKQRKQKSKKLYSTEHMSSS